MVKIKALREVYFSVRIAPVHWCFLIQKLNEEHRHQKLVARFAAVVLLVLSLSGQQQQQQQQLALFA